jgi:hypothetical protein
VQLIAATVATATAAEAAAEAATAATAAAANAADVTPLPNVPLSVILYPSPTEEKKFFLFSPILNELLPAMSSLLIRPFHWLFPNADCFPPKSLLKLFPVWLIIWTPSSVV